MKSRNLAITIKVLFSLFMIISAVGEITMNTTVVQSMISLGMPTYLLPFLGTTKILGVLALWVPYRDALKEWAYAGFTFDLIGAIYGFLATGHLIFPDLILAPFGLILCIASYALWKFTERIKVRQNGGMTVLTY